MVVSVMTTRIVFVGPLMFFSVLLCLWLTCLIPTSVCHIESSTVETSNRYECGPHGKFEYCIDSIPGCVIGCHCHPGYYFDTDTKICEPNTKLTQDFRRRYMPEPTRVHPVNTPAIVENIPTPTTISALDEKVDEIAKDTDDIGDWLFNQFFKTIETQVINNTNDDDLTPTRRSGLDVYRPGNVPKNQGGRARGEAKAEKIKTKARKSLRSKGKSKRKSKGHGLRRKLLRITEDDSLFDSDSGEGSSDDDSDESDSSDSSSSEGKSKESNKGGNDNKDHDHKKVIIFNRRPSPPLPSFIFLPNMDTPYYPPIGLPPPPVLPMYPMVPVPPMAPFIPFLEPKKDCDTCTTAAANAATPANCITTAAGAPAAPTTTAADAGHTTTAASAHPGHTDAAQTTTAASSDPSSIDASETTTAASDPAEAEATPANPDAPPDNPDAEAKPDENAGGETPSAKRTRLRGHRPRLRIPTSLPTKLASEETFMIRASNLPKSPKKSKHAERMKLMHKLRQKLKMQNKLPPVEENVVEDDNPLLDETRKQSRHKPQTARDDILNDVNFKYITELIHRVNLSDANRLPVPAPPKADSTDLKNTRRKYDPLLSDILHNDETPKHSNTHIQSPEDVYFCNLGRKIASMVRNVESKINNDFLNVPNSRQEPTHPLLQPNNYNPQSYWERTVRSPLTRFKNYFDKLHVEKHSSEKNLFSLENEVKTLATTVSPLSLQDIENLLNTLQKAQTDIQNSKQSTDLSNISFNVNLLPNKPGSADNTYRKLYNPLDSTDYFPRTKYLSNVTNIPQDSRNGTITHYLDPSNRDLPMIDDWMFNSQRMKQAMSSNLQTTINKSSERESLKYPGKSPIPFYKKIKKQTDYRHHIHQHDPAQNTEVMPKYQDLPVNYAELQPKYASEQAEKLAEQSVKNPEQPIKIPEPAKFPELSAKYAELSAKHPEVYAKYRELLTKYPDLHAKFPELLTKYTELAAKPSQPQKYHDMPIKYPMQPVKFQSNPSVVNYKAFDVISDSDNKHHYTFEASYPLLKIPSHRRAFSKRFESGSGRPSYFHHELHHFDYMD